MSHLLIATAVGTEEFSLVPAATVGGLVTGSLYALFAMSLVILMRTTGVGNFAAGGMAVVLSFLTYRTFVDGAGLSIWMAAPLAVVAGAALGVAIYGVVMAPLSRYGAMNGTFRTIGLFLLLGALATRFWGVGQPFSVEGLVSPGTVRVLGINVGYDQLAVLVTVLIVVVVLYLVIQRTRMGLWMRAVGSNREAASLIGVRVRQVEVMAWGAAGAMLAAIGILFAPITVLSTGMMDAFLINGFTAAVVGGIYSFPGAAIGGLLLGVVISVTSVFVGPAWQQLIALAVLLAVLRFRPEGIFGKERADRV